MHSIILLEYLGGKSLMNPVIWGYLFLMLILSSTLMIITIEHLGTYTIPINLITTFSPSINCLYSSVLTISLYLPFPLNKVVQCHKFLCAL